MIERDQRIISSLGVDSVYMLLHEGWSREARGNRWHFATRWARYLPVVLVVPETSAPWHVSIPEKRIPNCRILKVVANRGEQWSATAQIQISQIQEDISRSGSRRPLLWLYNAFFAEAYAALSGVARVHHVTENYYDFPGMSHYYLDRLEDIARISDLNVAVSEGCAKPLEPFVKSGRLVVVTNGCDFNAYGADVPPDREATALREGFKKLAVFAGNINDRIDFSLVEKTARAAPDTLFLFVGKKGLNRDLAAVFSDLLKFRNIRHWNLVPPDRLPSIYRAADLGFMPFAQTPVNVNNAFPLKTLEMAATGLPVVSSFLRPLVQYAPPLLVANNDADFLEMALKTRREPVREEALRRLAASQDYDAKFSQILDRLAALERHEGAMVGEGWYQARDGWKIGDLIEGLRYRFVSPVSRFVDRLPNSIRSRVVAIKRRLIG
ncbi:MAG: glycosyltransferase [Rhizomicrobium sp.]